MPNPDDFDFVITIILPSSPVLAALFLLFLGILTVSFARYVLKLAALPGY